MKLSLMFIIVVVASCSSISSDFKIGKCMRHSGQYNDTYKVIKTDDLIISMKNLINGNILKVSRLDKGWKEVECFE